MSILAAALLAGATPPPSISTLSAGECEPCHADVTGEWRRSRHASSFTNAVFLAAFRREPMRWCVRCHAPLPEQEAEIEDAAPLALAAEGINCAVCHVRDGEILTSRAPGDEASAAHPMRVEPDLGRSEFCGACHQFDFPGGAGGAATPMQDTLEEWRRSGAALAGETCQRCHMREGSHAFLGGHDAGWMQRSVRASVVLGPRGRVRIELASIGAGHRIPTGDPFRRIRVDLCADELCENVITNRLFRRVFRERGGVTALVRDDTIPPPGPGRPAVRTRELVLPEPAPRELYYRVVYAFAADSTEVDLEGDDLEIEIARGRADHAE